MEAVTSSHVLLEFYSVFSKLPLKTRISPLEIQEIIEKNIYSAYFFYNSFNSVKICDSGKSVGRYTYQ